LVKTYFADDAYLNEKENIEENIMITAYAVAIAESGGKPTACGDKNQSIGLWQIYMPAHFKEYDAGSLFDCDNNAKAAQAISNHGKNWEAWSTWKDDTYRNHLKEAREALGIPLPNITSVNLSRSVVSPGDTVTLIYNVTNATNPGSAMKLLLGATFRPTSGGTDLNDPANDLLVTIPPGSSSVQRSFVVPNTATPGTYDLIVSLMRDANNNNKVDGQDEKWGLKTFGSVLTISSATVCPGVTVTSLPSSVTYTKKNQTKYIYVTITNNSGASRRITAITKQSDELFNIKSISPSLPYTIRNGSSRTFSIRTQGPGSGLPVTAMSPYFNITLDCGTLSAAAVPMMPMPEQQLRVTDLRAMALGQELIFAAVGDGIASLQVEIYDLSGDKIFDSGEVQGNTLIWNLQNNAGQWLARGVYLYLVRVRGLNGEIYVSEIRKLVILR
jgi:hypothetical protein